MGSVPDEGLSKSPIEILKSVGVIVEQLHPEVVRSLGAIAASGTDQETQEWENELADAAERVQRALAVIFDRINEKGTEASEPAIELGPPINEESPEQEVEEEKLLVEAMTLTSPPIELFAGEAERLERALRYISSSPSNRHISYIVEEAYGVRFIAKEEHGRFVKLLNAYVAAGHIHRRSAFYGRMRRLDNEPTVQKATEPPIREDQPVAQKHAPPTPSKNQLAETSEATGIEAPTGPKLEAEDQLVLDYALSGKPFRMEELRSNVPAIRNLKPWQYQDFKAAFSEIMQRIVDYYAVQGIEASWEQEGKARGKTYQLIISQPPIAETEAAAEAPGGEPAAVQLPETIPVIEDAIAEEVPEPEVESIEPEPTEDEELVILSELRLSTNEHVVLRGTVDFLKQFEERQNLRTIISAVFGISRLSKAEESRLIQILDAYSRQDILRCYGRTYGYKSPAERTATETMQHSTALEELDQLENFEKEVLDFITSRAQNGELNIGEIVRGFFGVRTLEPQEFREFITRLNNLANRGYLVHAGGSPWYGVRQESQSPQPETVEYVPIIPLHPIQTPPKQELAVTSRAVRDERVELEPEQVVQLHPQPEEAKDIEEPTETNPEVELDDVARAIMEYARRGKFFRMEVMRREVPALVALTDEEYKVLKQSYSDVKALIQSYFSSQGLTAEWRERGKARGKEYQLVVSTGSGEDVKQAAKAAKVNTRPVSVRKAVASPPPRPRFYERTAEDLGTSNDGTVETQESPWRRTEAGDRRLLDHVANLERQAGSIGVKWTAIAKDYAFITGRPEPEARKLVREHESEGLLRVPGQRHQKGVRLLTSQAVEEADSIDGSNDRAADSIGETSSKEKEDVKAWTSFDAETAIKIFDQLLTLRHVQQGLTAKVLMRELGIDESREEEFRRTVRKMETAKFIYIDKKANPNTRSNNSKRIMIPLIKFPSQSLKELWKNDRQQVIEGLRTLVGSN